MHNLVSAVREAIGSRGNLTRTEPLYTLVVGAGFSHPSVPLTRQLVREEIGDFFYLHDAEMPGARTRSQKERASSRFWREFNAALPADAQVSLNPAGLPLDPGVAYQSLFAMRSSNPEFYAGPWNGAEFLKEFLQHFVNPAWSELNDAHFLLGCLLEVQQWGSNRTRKPFTRRIFTTNFDTLLQQALQSVGVLYTITDRPAAGFTQEEFLAAHEEAIHLIYTHGSILCHNPANTNEEISRLQELNTAKIAASFERQGVIVIGYAGWKDGIMAALAACKRFKHNLYWCDVHTAETALARLPKHVQELLEEDPTERFYVPLGEGGAGHLMASLYSALAHDLDGSASAGDLVLSDIKRLGLDRRRDGAERHERAFKICARYGCV